MTESERNKIFNAEWERKCHEERVEAERKYTVQQVIKMERERKNKMVRNLTIGEWRKLLEWRTDYALTEYYQKRIGIEENRDFHRFIEAKKNNDQDTLDEIIAKFHGSVEKWFINGNDTIYYDYGDRHFILDLCSNDEPIVF